MDRGKRSILQASTILALPLALLVGSVANGAQPKSRKSQTKRPTSQVRQVDAQVPANGASAPSGVLRAFNGMGHKAAASDGTNVQPAAGVLDGLMNRLAPKKKQAVNQQPPARPPANWNGIPFHAPKRGNAHASKGPIRDPQTAEPLRAAPAPMRNAPTQLSHIPTPPSEGIPPLSSAPPAMAPKVVNRSAPKPIQALPVSSRLSRSNSILSKPQDSGLQSLTAPPNEGGRLAPLPDINASRSSAPSTTSSSRRAGRREMKALDPSEIAAAARNSAAIAADKDLSAELVPKVSRRVIKVEEEPAVAKGKAPMTSLEIPTKIPTDKKPAVAKVEPKLPAPKLTPPARPASTKLAAPTQPVTPPALKTPVPAPKATPAPQVLTVAPPAAPTPAPAPAKTIEVPMPSSPLVNQTGPPATDFEPRASISELQMAPRATEPHANPIGSGVANHQSGTKLRPMPEAHVAQTPQMTPLRSQPSKTYPVDPYAVRGMAAPQAAQTHAAPYPTPQAATSPVVQQQQVYPHNQPATADMRARAPSRSAPSQSTVASELPGIRVVTHGPNEITIRQTYPFEIRVENRGAIDAEGVMVRAVIPDWAEVLGQNATRGKISPQQIGNEDRLVWTIDELPAGSLERMFVRLKAERSGTHGLDVDWTLTPQKSITKIKVHEPQLQLTIEGPDEVVYGKSQAYRVRVLNPGDGVAPNVVFTLSPNSPTPQTQRIGDIPPGKEAQFEVELTAQDLGNLKIDGRAIGDLELTANASKTIRVSAARLEATLAGPELKYQDTEATYNLQVQNKGIATSEKIVATLQLPAGVQYLDGLDKAVQRGSQLKWEIASLPPTASRDYQFRCKMNAPGDHSLSFNCKGSAAGEAGVSLTTKVEAIADLVMTINDPVAPAPIGTDVTYEIVIRNRGSKAASDVRAIAQFSHGIEPRRVDGHSGEILTGQVLFDPITQIAPGQEVKLRVVAKAERAGHHRFRSEIRAGDTVLVSEEATHYMSPRSERVSRKSSDSQETQAR